MFIFKTLIRSKVPLTPVRTVSRPLSRSFSVYAPKLNASPVATQDPSPSPDATENLSLTDLKATGKFSKSLLDALDKAKFHTLTPVQSKSLMPILQEEEGLVVRAKTGTGKTLAFVIPTIQNLIDEKGSRATKSKVSALVIAPTRDLAMQIENEYKKVIFGLNGEHKKKISISLLMGGKKTEIDTRYPPSIVIATPGRLEDTLSRPRYAKIFSGINYRIYDEADRILDVGFKDSLDNIDRLLKDARQEHYPDTPMFKSILFSATIDKGVDEFAREQINPQYNYINCVDESEGEAHENIHQTLVETEDTTDTYQSALSYISTNMNQPNFKAIVFLPTITATEWFFSVLKAARNNEIYDPIVHKKFGSKILKLNGKMSQNARDNSVRHFRQSKHGLLICTDVAARGLDFSDVSHVIQLSPSPSVADYIHKIGRTARAGAKGKALIFLSKPEQKFKRILEKQRGIKFAEEIKSSEIEQVDQVFSKIALDEEEVENFIKTFLGFQKQVSSVFRLDFETMVADVIKFYRVLLRDEDLKLFVTKNFISQILNIDFRVAEQYFEVPGGFKMMNNNRSAKRNTFSNFGERGGRGKKSYGSKSYSGSRDGGSRSYSGNRDGGSRSYSGNRENSRSYNRNDRSGDRKSFNSYDRY
ncbi:DEAD-domain-containing protein [Suhomyces tanzawaensis NRRL Y-17324]|uniref:ATP-dependent RNA helicase n=1 Tax=Suhomyces tanzawaensis NRRL Y-17324 TaxID=984487 RepID=A0A1E4SD61_9ASCO|nr:DEAD-domain-containing protein [Suhomyces tanzawaensis NRRL Y-17324]ODV77457.1 DEAD-domain-containing protein [Suhomyces tanzawaensis NRRL Y-17324]